MRENYMYYAMNYKTHLVIWTLRTSTAIVTPVVTTLTSAVTTLNHICLWED